MRPLGVLLLGLIGYCVASTAQEAGSPPPRDVGFGAEETVEIVEGWPFLIQGDPARCEALGPPELTVLEQGLPVEVVSVNRAERPATHVLMLDTSASMSDPRNEKTRRRARQTKAAARAYVDWMLEDARRAAVAPGRLVDEELMILTFDDDLILQASRGPVQTDEDAERFRRTIEAIRGGQQTFLNEGLWRLVKYLSGYRERSVIILLSDGRNTSGGRSSDDALEIVNETNQVTVFPIGIGLQPDDHERFLREIARQSGGRYFSVPNKKPENLARALEARFAEIRKRLQSEFYVSYVPRPLATVARGLDPERESLRLEVRLDSSLKGCKIDPQSYRPQRFIRLREPASDDDVFAESREGPVRIGDDRVRIAVLDAIRDGGLLTPGGELYEWRKVELLIPNFKLTTAAAQPASRSGSSAGLALEEVIHHWMIRGALPTVRADRDRFHYPLLHEINGKSFLDARGKLARAIYDHFDEHGSWAREKIGARIREEYRRKLLRRTSAEALSGQARQELEQQIEALVGIRLAHPTPADLERELAEWHGDVSARELAFDVERLQANALLADLEDARPVADAIQHLWFRLYDWLNPPARVHITTPLVLAYDPRRDVFGLTRIVLPRAHHGLSETVPEQPYGLQLVRWMLGIDPFGRRDGKPPQGARAGLARTLRQWRIESLWHAPEPFDPEEDGGSEAFPRGRNRYGLRLRPPSGGAVVLVQVVADTAFMLTPGWDGRPPAEWSIMRGELIPRGLIPRCWVAGDGNPVERALAEAGLPGC